MSKSPHKFAVLGQRAAHDCLGPKQPVLVHGMRTPFVKSFGTLMKVDSIGLGVASCAGLLKKMNFDPRNIDHVIWGNVCLQTNAPNMAREVIIDLNLPRTIPGHMTSMACSSGLNAIFQADTWIRAGESECVLSGGADSLSCAEVPLPRDLVHGLGVITYGKKKGMAALKTITKHAGYPGPKWVPVMPSIKERSTGHVMGWHADKMAELAKVSKEAQAEWAVNSHKKAAAAADNGTLDEEITPCAANDGSGKIIDKDDLIRRDMNMEKMMKLKSCFRKPEEGGTITAATSSALTDGGSAVMVMTAERALELGLPADCRLLSCIFTGIDPNPQLLLAPAIAIPKALDAAGLTWQDIDWYEIHEAFAGQVLATEVALNTPEFLDTWLDGRKPLGYWDYSKVNPNGGSIAIGHPFSATGGRVITAVMNQLRRTGARYGLVSICAAGGLGSVGIVEHNPKGFLGEKLRAS